MENLSLDELHKRVRFSVRAYNSLLGGDITTLDELVEKIKDNKLSELTNCGTKTVKEILKLCTPYLPQRFQKKAPRIISIPDFRGNYAEKLQFLQTHFEDLIAHLSTRAKHSLFYLLGKNPKVSDFYSVTIAKFFVFRRLLNAGAKTTKELIEFRQKVVDALPKINEIDEEVLAWENIKKQLTINYSFDIDQLNSLKGIIFKERRIRIFALLKQAIFNEPRLSATRKTVAHYHFEHASHLTLLEIGEILNISRERVRLLKIELDKSLINALRIFDYSQPEVNLSEYGISATSDLLLITNELVQTINNAEHTKFNQKFIYLSISCLLPTHDRIDKLFVRKTDHQGYQLKNYYLINRSILVGFSLTQFFKDIRSQTKLKKQWFFDIDQYVKERIREPRQVKRLIYVCKMLIRYEWSDWLDKDGNLANHKKNTLERLVEVLESEHKLIHLKDITKKVNLYCPNKVYSERQLRSCLLSNRATFISTYTGSMFGLKKWERDMKGIKGGTIRNIVYEFLQRSSKPRTMNDIMKEVRKFRPTASKISVRTSLKLSSKVIVNKLLVGLAEKKYEVPLKKPKATNSWMINHDAYRKFVIKSGRAPRHNKNSSKERKLYSYYYVNIKKFDARKLPEERQRLFEELIKLKKVSKTP